MIRIFVRHTVKDFDKWLEGFRGYEEIQKDLNRLGGGVANSIDDPHSVTVFHDFADMDAAQRYMSLPNLKELMEAVGVVGEPEIWVTQVAS